VDGDATRTLLQINQQPIDVLKHLKSDDLKKKFAAQR
jgi:hypothetical protein